MKIELKEWNGGEMPVKEGTPVIVLHRDGECYNAKAGGNFSVDWQHDCSDGDIVAYAVIGPVYFNGQPIEVENF